MNYDATHVATVGLKVFQYIQSFQSVVVIEDADVHVVRAGDDPVLPGHETCGSHGKTAQIYAVDHRNLLVVCHLYLPSSKEAKIQGSLGWRSQL